jgi:hypothetical protein
VPIHHRKRRRIASLHHNTIKKLFLYTTIAFLTAASAVTGLAKDDKKKDKDKDKDKEPVVYVERDGRRYTIDRDGKRHWIDGERDRDRGGDYRDRDDDRDRRDYRSSQDRSRSIYVIERNRPVERVVYVDSAGRYYRVVDGRRSYVQEHYYESFPSKYYYPDGRRRVTITLPF